ncbi:MAG: hypothetical protein ACUVX9_00100 [Anaerolineae bacterium]
MPYLEHLGIPHTTVDLAASPLPENAGDYALIIIAHRRLDPAMARMDKAARRALLAACAAGTGLVTFDTDLPSPAEIGAHRRASGTTTAEAITFGEHPHYITACHMPGETLPLVGPLRLPLLAATDASTLIMANGHPLVAAGRLGEGRFVQWATSGWMHSGILGPLAGLDDVFWRSLVWAARKPFVLRGLGPLVCMRVDDVAATGGLWGQSPLYWVHEANRHGFKPWLGIFPYNLTEPAVNELRDLTQRGQATASPHALGLRSRPDMVEVYYRGEPAAQGAQIDENEFVRFHGRRPCPADLDEFIYFDHLNGRPWSDSEAVRRLAAVDEWYAAHAPLPMSNILVPHWSEIGRNVVAHVHERWGTKYGIIHMDAGRPYRLSTPWLKLGPFRRYEAPGTAAINPARRGQRPFFVADFLNLAGYRFFDCITEIRSDAGYEWMPDNDVSATVGRGVRQLRRAFDSMALPVLFTHETDHIYRISPDNWSAAMARVACGIADYGPIYVTLDEGMRYVRATHTSRLESCTYHSTPRELIAVLSGQADVRTHLWLFTENRGEIEQRLLDVPPFDDGAQVVYQIGS